jgi:hypothetical protein
MRTASCPTFGLTGRRRAKRDGNPTAQLLGAPVEPGVGQPSAKNHHRNSVRRANKNGSYHGLVFAGEAEWIWEACEPTLQRFRCATFE